MFSSSTSSWDNQFQLHCSFRLPSFAGQNGDVLVQQDHELLAGHLFPANAPVVVETLPAFLSEGQNGDDRRTFSNKKPARKDRHSKILTAQGPRDRRLRLSIEVSRKFFALQDMLGFDKASKTLDWLFTKSKAAIRDLERMKHCFNGEKSLSSTSGCEVESGGTNKTVDSSGDNNGLGSISKTNKVKKRRQLLKTTLHIPTKGSREKARARARERTREKMCVKELPVPADFKQPIIQNQSKFGCCEKLGSHSQKHILYSSKMGSNVSEKADCFQWLVNHASWQDMIDESIMIKRKPLPTPIFAFQENPIILRDVNSIGTHYPNTIASSSMTDIIAYQT